MIRAFKYRMYPTPKQLAVMEHQFGLCRWLHNCALEHRITSFKAGKPVSYKDQANELPSFKESFPDFKTVHSQILQDVLKRLDKSFQHFFRRVKQGDTPGYPRFKGKERFHSISYPQSGFSVTGSRIYLSGMGKVRVRVHRDITRAMQIKTCTIKKSGDHWYGILSVELQSVPVPKKVVTNPVGIDLGLSTFATISNGEIIDNPRYLRHSEKKLAIIQAAYALRKTKAFKRKMTTLHQKIAHQRYDFLHKESTKLVNRFDLIAFEDLSIKNMAQRCKPVQTEGGGFASNGQTAKSGLNKSIYDAGWGKFIAMLIYKAESAGSYAIAVNPYNTSQICSGCGTIVKKTLKKRQHECPVCGRSVDRDLNASYNILRLGTDRVKEGFA